MTDNVLTQVVAKTLCIGCGTCATVCPRKRLHVPWNDMEGLPQAEPIADPSACDARCGLCLKVCPFSMVTQSSAAIAAKLFRNQEGVEHHQEGGYWLKAFVGFAPDDKIRTQAASGGLVTLALMRLMESGQITAAACVGSTHADRGKRDPLFSYQVCRDPAAIISCSRSAYYPVGMEAVLREILHTPGRYAIVALPCMARALRLLCEMNHTIRERIVFVLGLACGQVKTAHFSEFIAARCGFAELDEIQFRVKSPEYPSANFGVRVSGDAGRKKVVNFNELSRFWSDRYFTPQACNCCTDLFAETADAVFMDAWSPGLESDWRGWSYVVVRNPILLGLFEEVACAFPKAIGTADYQKVINSQESGLVSKREDVHWRLKQAARDRGYQDHDCPPLRKPRTSRRLITEMTYVMSQRSNSQWIEHRFDVSSFLRSMSVLRLKIELSRQVWRVARLAGLIKHAYRSNTH